MLTNTKRVRRPTKLVRRGTTRWVQRDGKTVRFAWNAGRSPARMHEHHLPTEFVAEQFAFALMKMDEDGSSAAIDPEQWASWQHAYDHPGHPEVSRSRT